MIKISKSLGAACALSFDDGQTKIIYAYQNDEYFLDVNITDKILENEESQETPEQKQADESNILSIDEMKENVRELVRKDLRRISGMPPTEDVINSFFKILDTQTIPSVDGVGLDIYKAMNELFRRKKVDFVDKHVNSGNLSVKFEVYLKKLYYMLHGEELRPSGDGQKVTLANCIFAFPCLKRLKWSVKETEQKMSGYLDVMRNNRNTNDGNGAHSSYLLTEQQLDDNIKAFMTLYLYVTGLSLNDLKDKYNI